VPLLALKHGCESLAFTYNEPTSGANTLSTSAKKPGKIWPENVMVTNGYITYEAFTTFTITSTQRTSISRPLPRIFTEDYADASSAGAGDSGVAEEETPVWFEITNLMIQL